MGWLKAVIAVYALLNIGGGIEGYVTKHSVPSIISGVIAGILLIVGLFIAGGNAKVGYIICAVVALGDLGFFAPKFFKTQQLWPAGVMAAASLVVVVCLVAAHLTSHK